MASVLNNAQMSASFQTNVTSPVSTVKGTTSVLDQTVLNPSILSTAGGVDGCYTTTGSVTSGTPVTIDVTALVDPLGQAITAGHICGIKIANNSGANNLTHGGGSNPIYATQPLTIGPGDYFAQSLLGNSFATSGSVKNLQLAASAATINYTVTIFTRSG